MPETAWSLPLHCFAAAAAALVAFSRCLLGDVHFTNFDDDRNYEWNKHVQGLSVASLRWSIEDGTLIGVFEPVSNVLKMLLGSLVGITARSVVTTNVVLHACVVGVSVVVSERLVLHVRRAYFEGMLDHHPSTSSSPPPPPPPAILRPAMAASAVFFGCHPMRVEAVAWASCMPYLHAALFLQLSLYAHLRTTTTTTTKLPLLRVGFWRCVSFVSFALASFCKAPAVTFVGFLVILDACCDKLRRPRSATGYAALSVARRTMERGPELLVAAVAVRTAMVAASTEDWDKSESSYRVIRAALAVLWYLSRALFPHGLTCRLFCPKVVPTAVSASAVSVVFGLTGLLVLRVLLPASSAPSSAPSTAPSTASSPRPRAAFSRRRRHHHHHHQRAVAAALAWGTYLLLLLPTLGLVSAHIVWLAAERYSYLPMLLVGVPACGGGAATVVGSAGGKAARVRVGLLFGCAALLLGTQTWSLSRVWADSETLWLRTLVVNPSDHAAMGSLGNLQLERGRFSEAEEWQRRAVATRPLYAPYRANLGNALNAAGRAQEAHDAYQLSIEFVRNGTDPHPKSLKSLPDSFYNLGLLYLKVDRDAHALQSFDEALRIADEDRMSALLNSKGFTLLKLGHASRAVESLRDAVARDPTNAEAHNNLVGLN
jgi:tetratricopeptide (TPR) repeat protein